jgi:superfamily I DNA and/or RNA helicase
MAKKFTKINSFKNPHTLFRQVLSNLLFLNRTDEYLSHAQIANLVFGNGDAVHQSYLSAITANFSHYIQYGKAGTYKFNFDLIKEHFPEFFGPKPVYDTVISEILDALKHEKYANFKNRQGKIIYVKNFDFIGINEESYYYSLFLDIEQDEKVSFYEAMQIKIAIDKLRFTVLILDYDPTESKLIIKSEDSLESYLRKAQKIRLVVDATWMINKLTDRLENYPLNKTPVNKLLTKRWGPSTIEDNDSFYKGYLDDGQIEAVKKCIANDITAIWGPPGTGKSITVSFLILELLKRKERTLVCSIANVAVDAIILNCLDTFLKNERDRDGGGVLNYREGKLIRLGYSNNPAIQDNPDIKVNSYKIIQLESELNHINKQLNDKSLSDFEVALLKDRKIEIIDELENEKTRIVRKANVVFATATKATIDKLIFESEFDNLIIDEASMMSAPYLLALARNVGKRIIIAGDFRQLGPIVISQSSLARKWLKKDLFQFFGINYYNDTINHASLAMIYQQRRFHKSICDLINGAFYENRLQTKTENKNLVLYKQEPVKDTTIIYYDLSNEQKFECKRTSQHSRFNEFSANFIIDQIVIPLQKHKFRTRFSIVIISPYAGQINVIKNILKEKINDKNFLERVKCGTVHSFQGSQADLIIFDMVDDSKMKNGRLYWHEDGERLINVAISRATGKLIFVGDVEAITGGSGHMNVSHKVRIVLNKIAKNKIT